MQCDHYIAKIEQTKSQSLQKCNKNDRILNFTLLKDEFKIESRYAHKTKLKQIREKNIWRVKIDL